jgi:hypothetical protein
MVREFVDSRIQRRGEPLLLHLVEDDQLSKEELDEIRRSIPPGRRNAHEYAAAARIIFRLERRSSSWSRARWHPALRHSREHCISGRDPWGGSFARSRPMEAARHSCADVL